MIAGLEVNGSLVDLVGLYTLAILVNAAAMLFGTGVAMRLRTMQAGPADAGAGVPAAVPGARSGSPTTCSPAG